MWKDNHTTDCCWLLTKKPLFKSFGNHQPQKRQSYAKKQKANTYELHHKFKNKKKGKGKVGVHFTDLELAHLASIIKPSEDGSIDTNFTDAEAEDAMGYSNLHASSSLNHELPDHHESITDITNFLQVEITEEDTEEPVFETWKPQGFTIKYHGIVWKHDPTQYGDRSSMLNSPFLLTTPF